MVSVYISRNIPVSAPERFIIYSLYYQNSIILSVLIFFLSFLIGGWVSYDHLLNSLFVLPNYGFIKKSLECFGNLQHNTFNLIINETFLKGFPVSLDMLIASSSNII